MSTKIMNWLYEAVNKDGFYPNVKTILFALAWKAFDDGRIGSTLTDIARHCSIKKSNASIAFKMLTQMGILERIDGVWSFTASVLEPMRSSYDYANSDVMSMQTQGYDYANGGYEYTNPEVMAMQTGVMTVQTGVMATQTPSNIHIDIIDSIPPIHPPTGGLPADGGRSECFNAPPLATPSLDYSELVAKLKEEVLVSIRQEQAQSVNTSLARDNGPNERSKGEGATSIPPNPETPASVAENGYGNDLFPEVPSEPVNEEPKAKTYPARFEEWWKSYPSHRRVAKSQCLQKWRLALKNTTEEALFVGLGKHLNSAQWQRNSGQYVCQTTKFFNQSYWNNDPEPGKYIITELGGYAVSKVEGSPSVCDPEASSEGKRTQVVLPTLSEKAQAFYEVYRKFPKNIPLFESALETALKGVKLDHLLRCAGWFVEDLSYSEDGRHFHPLPENWLLDHGWDEYIGRIDPCEGMTEREKDDYYRKLLREGKLVPGYK